MEHLLQTILKLAQLNIKAYNGSGSQFIVHRAMPVVKLDRVPLEIVSSLQEHLNATFLVFARKPSLLDLFEKFFFRYQGADVFLEM